MGSAKEKGGLLLWQGAANKKSERECEFCEVPFAKCFLRAFGSVSSAAETGMPSAAVDKGIMSLSDCGGDIA